MTDITVDVKKGKIVLLLTECAACNGNDREYSARLGFQFPTGYLATADVDQIEDVISQVLTDEAPKVSALPAPAPPLPDTEPRVLTNDDVLKLVRARVPDSIVIESIKSSNCAFDTSPDALIGLKRTGVSAAVLQAMAEAPPVGPGGGMSAGPREIGLGIGSGTIYSAKNGTEFHTGKAGNLMSLKTKSGAEALFGANGKLVAIHSGGLTVRYGARGGRMVETKDGRRVVSYGEHRGYVEHWLTRGGSLYIRRTYVVNGRRYAVMYRGFPYRGAWYFDYFPAYYYAPGFYGWAYNPWAAPVAFAWGWAGDPRYGFYRGYFTPYPAYAEASLWLTDYVLAENLRAAYQAQLDGNGGNPPPPADSGDGSGGAAAPQTATGITPETKAAIAEEVKAQLAAEKAAAGGQQQAADQPPAALDPKVSTFIVSTTLTEQWPGGAPCSLSTGDILTRISTNPDANQNVIVLVTSDQSGDCSSGVQVAVSVQDLQDMYNDFAANIDAGLQKLADNQSKGGLPAGPAAGRQANADAQTQPDLTATAHLQQQQQAADQAEAEVKQALGSGRGNN